MRESHISRSGLKDRRFDEDGDGYSKCNTTGCPKPGVDFNDYAASIHPGAKEICSDGNLNKLDRCPFVANPDQVDSDGDGAGDPCDDDTKGDGVRK